MRVIFYHRDREGYIAQEQFLKKTQQSTTQCAQLKANNNTNKYSMFSLFNGIYDSYLAPTQLNLLVVGSPESGKTALLERLKVTEIPKKGSSGTRTVQQRIAADDLPETLKKALLRTGAGRSRSLSRTSLASIASSRSAKSVQQPTPVVKPKPEAAPVDRTEGNVVVVTRKNRLALFCPAPERYSKASQDQDEEYVEAEDSFPPQRVRVHSKEMNVDSLDLSMKEDLDNSIVEDTKSLPKPQPNQRETSMQSIGLDDNDHPKAPLHHQQQQHVGIGPALLNSSAQQYNVKANAKMLPLRMIRPTSKFCLVL